MPDLDYNQYECQQNYIKERMQSEAKCLWPYQIYNRLIKGKNICVNMTDFEGKSLHVFVTVCLGVKNQYYTIF